MNLIWFSFIILSRRVDIPKAPGLGLMLDKLHYDSYNRKFGNDGMHQPLDWDDYKEEMEAFKLDQVNIYTVVGWKLDRGNVVTENVDCRMGRPHLGVLSGACPSLYLTQISIQENATPHLMTGATESLFTKATYYKKREGLGTGYGCNHWVSGECYPPLTLWRPSIRNFFLKNGNGMAKNGHYLKKNL